MQSQSVVTRLRCLVGILVLNVRQLGLTPDRLCLAELNSQRWVRNEPVVDLGAVHGVLAECQTRVPGATGAVHEAPVRAPCACERGEVELPLWWEDADYRVVGGVGRECSAHADEAEGGKCEKGLHRRV